MDRRTRLLLLSFVLAVIVAGHAFVLAKLWDQVLAGGADFTAFHAAGRIVNDGEGARLYRWETQQTFQNSYPWRKEPLLFYHPPFEVLLFLPLAQLSFSSAFLIWFLLNLFLVGACALVRHPEDLVDPESTLLRAIGILMFYPVMLCLIQGQDSILLLLLFSLAFVGLKKGHQLRSGCFLGLALFKFQFVLPLLFVFLVTRKIRVVAGVLLTLLALAVVSVPLVGWEGLADYPRFLLESNRSLARGTIHPESMPSLRGFLSLVGNGLPTSALTAVTAALSAGLLILCARLWPEDGEKWDSRFDLAFALSVVLSVLAGYHVNGHDLTLLILPIGLVVRHLRMTRTQKQSRHRLLVALLTALFIPSFLLPGNVLPPGLAFWGMLLLSVAIMLEMKAQRRLAPTR